jgi:HD domain
MLSSAGQGAAHPRCVLAQGITASRVQAMDLQQLFLAMTEDARIILVKLADRLHNMRTMASMPPHKQAKIAAETLRVFAPLAGLLGLWAIKTELEDLSLRCACCRVRRCVRRMHQLLIVLSWRRQPWHTAQCACAVPAKRSRQHDTWCNACRRGAGTACRTS